MTKEALLASYRVELDGLDFSTHSANNIVSITKNSKPITFVITRPFVQKLHLTFTQQSGESWKKLLICTSDKSLPEVCNKNLLQPHSDRLKPRPRNKMTNSIKISSEAVWCQHPSWLLFPSTFTVWDSNLLKKWKLSYYNQYSASFWDKKKINKRKSCLCCLFTTCVTDGGCGWCKSVPVNLFWFTFKLLI